MLISHITPNNNYFPQRHKEHKVFFMTFVFFVSLWEIIIISFYDLCRCVYKIHRL